MTANDNMGKVQIVVVEEEKMIEESVYNTDNSVSRYIVWLVSVTFKSVVSKPAREFNPKETFEPRPS